VGREALPEALPLEEAEDLAPWATELRYGTVPQSTLDRADALRVAQAFREWARQEVEATPSGQ